ncbi:1-aminocyclopropane-1-carboxylate deaminase/D-cysteine desulfhydrase [Candidatus Bipolaricaulota bacterium]
MQLGGIPRLHLGEFPTPLQELKNLGHELGGPRIFVKRDDQTGLGLGGNKLRKLEYALAEAVSQKATVVITVGGPQSNHVRLTTAACNKLGLKTILVIRGKLPERPSGNLLIDHILGPLEIHYVGSDGFPSKGELDRVANEKAEEIAIRLRSEGEVPYFIPNGCRAIHGAMGYASCILELISQFRDLQLAPTAVFTAVGTSSTQTGLILGAHLFTHDQLSIIGISVGNASDVVSERVARQLDEAVATFELQSEIPRRSIIVLDQYVGDGYGIPTAGMKEAVLLTAQTEGVLLDPVYTGKAMSGLIDRIRSGDYSEDDIVVMLHTGGTPALFADNQINTFIDGTH